MYTSHIVEEPAYDSSTLKVFRYNINADNATDPVQSGEVTVHHDGCTGVAHIYIAGETNADYMLDAMEDAEVAATEADFDFPLPAVRAAVAAQVAAWESWRAELDATE